MQPSRHTHSTHRTPAQQCHKLAAAHLREALLLDVALLHGYQPLQPMLFELGRRLLRPEGMEIKGIHVP